MPDSGAPDFPKATHVSVGELELSVHMAGNGPAIILAHGFPDLAYSWRHQIPALVDAGYRVIAPDMRGFGASDRPTGPQGYDAVTVGADLIGVLDAFSIEQAVFIGHDWGASSVWPLALDAPERVRAVVGLSVPYVPAAPVSPLQIMRRRLGDDFYMVRAQQVGPPEAELEADVEHALLAVFTDHEPFTPLGPLTRPAWMTDPELDRYVRAYRRSGFRGGLNYYRNIEANWTAAQARGARTTDVPALFVTGDLDMVARFMPATRMPEVFTAMQSHTIAGAGHWLHQQFPGEVNRLLLEFLSGLPN